MKVHEFIHAYSTGRWFRPEEWPRNYSFGVMTPGFLDRVFPIAAAKDERGDECVAVAVVHHIFGPEPGQVSPNVWIRVPGLCGHMDCGGVIEVSLQ